jgi:CheY-like chemotaxis protein
VADTGQGLAPELLPRVFELFVQGDRSVSRGTSGLGIGLTMVQRLVWLHGGTVEAQSAGPGLGSEFIVRLPLLPGHHSGETKVEPGGVAAASKGRRILIVDDNRDAAETLADLAGLWGFEAQAVFDGATGLQVARDTRPGMILLDISMPGMSGFEVARSIRRLPGLEGVLLVALTGYGQEEDRRRTREAGFDHHLTKPVDPDVLRKLLETWNRK